MGEEGKCEWECEEEKGKGGTEKAKDSERTRLIGQRRKMPSYRKAFSF